jgi:hypothetical protein
MSVYNRKYLKALNENKASVFLFPGSFNSIRDG